MDKGYISNVLRTLDSGADLCLVVITRKGEIQQKTGKFKGGLELIGYIDKDGIFDEQEQENLIPCYQFFFREQGKRRLSIERSDKVCELKIV